MTTLHEEKLCPACGETVKSPARICRFCRHEFVDHESHTESPGPRRRLLWLFVASLCVLVGAIAFFLFQERGNSGYGSVSELVEDLEEEGVPCGNNSGVLDNPQGPEKERILCRYDTPAGFTVALVDEGKTDDLLAFFRETNEEAMSGIVAAGGDPMELPSVQLVIGSNWIISTPDDSLAAEIQSILKGRLETFEPTSVAPSPTPPSSPEPIESEAPVALNDSACVREDVCFYVGQATADLVGVEFVPESHGIFGSSEFATCVEQLSAFMDRAFNLGGDTDTSYLQEPLRSQANGLLQFFSRQEWPDASVEAANEIVARCGDEFGTSLD